MTNRHPNCERSNTICWNCTKATGGCNWSDKLEPVKGWVAAYKPVHVSGYVDAPSYVVYECPDFKKG